LTNTLSVQNLYKIFGPRPDEALALAKEGVEKDEIFRRTQSLAAVNDVSFVAEENEVFVVMGLSGSGKSTLIRCINRLFEPTSGTVKLGDQDITQARQEELRQLRLNHMSMVFQHFALLPHKTVCENAEYGLKTRGLEKHDRREQAMEALKTVGLDAWADMLPSALSGGMQQRVGLARALAVTPRILLMDEPFSALDPLIRRDMQDELIRIQDRMQTTIIFITHDLQEALKIGHKIAIMRNGQFVQVGTPEEIVTDPANDYVLEFTRDVDRSRVLTFRTIMDDPEIVQADTSGADLRKLFESKSKLNGAFVTDGSGAPTGVVRRSAALHAEDGDTAETIMSRDFPTMRAGKYIQDAFDVIRNSAMIAVTDRNGKLIGAVDPISVFSYLQAPLKEEEDSAQSDEPARVHA